MMARIQAVAPRARIARITRGAIALLALVACGGGDVADGPTVEVADSAGIRIRSLHGQPGDTLSPAARAARIGADALDAPAEYQFHLVSDVAVCPDGRVVVVDNRGARVAVFDPDGRWLADIGRRGRGPGEYEAPITAAMAAEELILWDAVLRRLTRYTCEGELLGTVLIADHPGGLPIAAIDGGTPASPCAVMSVRPGTCCTPTAGPHSTRRSRPAST